MSPRLNLTRRRFIAGTTAASFAAVLSEPTGLFSAEPTPEARVGSQLYGWGQYYQREGRRIEDHLDEVFSALRDAGYDHAEGSLNLADPDANGSLADRMKARGLRPVAIYTGGRLHDPAAETVIEQIIAGARVCREAGYRVINCNPDPIGREKTDVELAHQARSLETLGSELRALGMELGIHHHTPAMRSEAREFHYNFQHTKAENVGFCYDVHWVYRGGVNPPKALEQYGDRVVSWHLRQSREGVWWEDLASGDIDYSAVAAFARDRKLSPVYSVELALESGTKVTRSVVANHARSREFVRRVFGV